MSESNVDRVPNVSGIDVAPNDIMQIRWAVNRNLLKLLQNDKALDALMSSIFGSVKISEYLPSKTYNANDLVWVRIGKDGKYSQSGDLYLLRCLKKGVCGEKLPLERDPDGSFERCGWKNENEVIDIRALVHDAVTRLQSQLFSGHVKDLHAKFGSLVSDDLYYQASDVMNVASAKLMQRNFGNRNRQRDRNQYPYKTVFLAPDDVILDGCCRIYDCGLLEYDITYRLGYAGKKQVDGVMADRILCNVVKLKQYTSATNSSLSRTNVGDYFYSRDDYEIFSRDGGKSSVIGGTIQENRNDFVNAYAGEIRFPYRFADTNYMIFGSGVTSKSYGDLGEVAMSNVNKMVYVNKSRQSVTPLYVMREDLDRMSETGYNATHGGLASNSFHCRIIGMAE